MTQASSQCNSTFSNKGHCRDPVCSASPMGRAAPWLAAAWLAHSAVAVQLVGPRRLATDVAWALLCRRGGPKAEPAAFQQLTLEDVEIRDAGSKGLGVYAKRPLPKGGLIVRYTGALRTFDEHQGLCDRGQANFNYVFNLGSDYIIDAVRPAGRMCMPRMYCQLRAWPGARGRPRLGVRRKNDHCPLRLSARLRQSTPAWGTDSISPQPYPPQPLTSLLGPAG